MIGGERVGFYIEERHTRHKTVITEDELKRYIYKPRFEFRPSGKLSLRIKRGPARLDGRREAEGGSDRRRVSR